MLPLVVIVAIIALIVMIVGGVFLWLTGLLIAFIFFAISVMLLYALHEVEALDVQENKWLIVLPIAMFFLGLGVDKAGLLSLQPLSLSSLLVPVSTEAILFIIIIILLAVDIFVGLKKLR